MGFKKIDNRLRILMENGITQGHRTMFLIVGPKARDQVVILHQMLSKSQVKARPSVLWCYKKELGFSSHRKKRMRVLQKKMKMGIELDNLEDMFETFIAQTNIRYTYYKETHKILGNTYGMLVLQDFEAITPNILARTIETIEGGGIICLLLNSITSLKQLHAMTMDVHSRYRTESHQDVVARFNERFILSVAACPNCVIVDDKLNILPISSHIADIAPVPKTESSELTPEESELRELKESLAETQPVGSIINLCKTLDQAKAVLKFIDVISEKTLSHTVSLTAGRGRGKSAALGLSIAAAIAFNYSNIYVTSPSPENLKTLFDFILKGFDAIALKEHLDYDIIQSTNEEFNKAIVRINIFRQHRQCIQYIHPADAAKNKLLVQSAELVVIDEAAAIPLPIVKSLLGSYLVFMSSTIQGYEGTGRSLSLKLLEQLRQQSVGGEKSNRDTALQGRNLFELTLNESIRYRNGDEIELWLNKLLCLDASIIENPITYGCPVPEDCNLFYINRDTLFSYHKASENFLQRIMALYVSSHYKNSPNDLQMISDAPAHHLFCLLPPISAKHMKKVKIPDVLCFVQVCLEGKISQDLIDASLSRGKRAAGDLIPWTISQQFQDSHFASLSGARVVRIATNPNYQKMGYGSRALKLLEDYYRGLFNVNLVVDDAEDLETKTDENGEEITKVDAPLLLNLNERKAEKLDYLGVSFGLTPELLKFWKKSRFTPVYLRQTPNDLTGEHSCIMLKVLGDSDSNATEENQIENAQEQQGKENLFHTDLSLRNNWLHEFWVDFRRRFVSLLSYQFSQFSSVFALSILQNTTFKQDASIKEISRNELIIHFTTYDLKRIELYTQNLVDYHLIVDLLPIISRLYFLDRFGTFHMSHLQNVILLSIGLQHNEVEKISAELNLPTTQILGLFSRSIKKFSNYFTSIRSKEIEDQLKIKNVGQANLNPLSQSLEDELEEAAEIMKKVEQRQKRALSKDLTQYRIKGSEDDWDRVLKGSQKSLVSIKSIAKRPKSDQTNDHPNRNQNNKKNKPKKFKKH